MSEKTKAILEALNKTLNKIKELEGYEEEGLYGPGGLDRAVYIESLKLQESLKALN